MISIENINEFSEELPNDIGKLMPILNSKYSNKLIDPNILQDIIKSPYHALFVAKKDNLIVGVAVLSVVMGVDIGKNAYLESFVIDPSFQGQGISSKMWNKMLDWAKENDCKKLEFTSNPRRKRAISFYKKNNAKIYDTNFFQLSL